MDIAEAQRFIETIKALAIISFPIFTMLLIHDILMSKWGSKILKSILPFPLQLVANEFIKSTNQEIEPNQLLKELKPLNKKKPLTDKKIIKRSALETSNTYKLLNKINLECDFIEGMEFSNKLQEQRKENEAVLKASRSNKDFDLMLSNEKLKLAIKELEKILVFKSGIRNTRKRKSTEELQLALQEIQTP